MCFSEEASFTAAALLGVMSIGCFRIAKNEPKLYPLATIPLGFAIQQAAEGVEWLHFKGIWGTFAEALSAKYIFLFFAFCFWPTWIPFSLYMPEKNKWKKSLLLLLSIIGLGFAFYTGSTLLTEGAQAEAAMNSIQYKANLSTHLLWLYMILVIAPFFISSYSRMALVGTIYAFSAAVSAYFYNDSFTSVWCFFAAVISIFLMFAIKQIYTEMHPPKTKSSI